MGKLRVDPSVSATQACRCGVTSESAHLDYCQLSKLGMWISGWRNLLERKDVDRVDCL